MKSILFATFAACVVFAPVHAEDAAKWSEQNVSIPSGGIMPLEGTLIQESAGGDAVTVSGRLDVGSWTDPETGFVSQIRIVDASFRRS